MRFGLDTNILVYAEGFDDAAKQEVAKRIVRNLPDGEVYVSVNVLGELFNVLTRRKLTREQAQSAAVRWRTSFSPVETTTELMLEAIGLAALHNMGVWDALVLAAAAETGCDVLLSEDFQDGFRWKGVMVANPFVATPQATVISLLR